MSVPTFLNRVRRALLGPLALLCAWGPARAETAPLTSIGDIRALSAERAREALPVRVRGVVTHANASQFFMQDGPDAIFVWQESGAYQPKLGDYVEADGFTHSGHLFPIVRSPRVRFLEYHGLPEPRILRYGELASGRGDCQWIEVAAFVEAVLVKSAGALTLHVQYDGALLRVDVDPSAQVPAGQLLGARLRLRGVVSGLKSPQRKLIEPVLAVSGAPENFRVESPGPEDPFTTPLKSADALGGPAAGTFPRDMVRIAGVVTGQSGPQLVFVRDREQSLEIRLAQPTQLNVGDRIEAVGFVEMGIIQPVLKNAYVRQLAAGDPPVPRILSEAAQLLDLRNEAELVSLEGELLDVAKNQGGYVLFLADKTQTFSVEVNASLVAAGTVLPPVGSRLALVGICLIEQVTPPDLNQVVAPASVRLRLRSLDDLRVLSRPSWWTLPRLLAAVAVLSFFALGATAWIWTLNRRVQTQTRIILDHARQQAVLEERERIAREFHDTIEQQIAGATILLDAVDTVVVSQPQRARDSLHTARAMLRHSLDEAQQAVANLRSNDLFEREFAPLVEEAVQERVAASGHRVEFRHEGAWPALDSVVKQHLLRIVQESVTNVVKHARARLITVTLSAGPKHIGLQVADDGCGFDPLEPQRRGAGQFGLHGLHERAEKIGACLTINSAPRVGTTITVTLNPSASSRPPHE